MPAHYFITDREDEYQLGFATYGQPNPISVSIKDADITYFKTADGSFEDCCVVEMPASYPVSRKLRQGKLEERWAQYPDEHLFPTVSLVSMVKGSLVVKNLNSTRITRKVYDTKYPTGSIHSNIGLKYRAHTVRGDCGSLLIDATTHKILGYHSMGDSTVGYAELLTWAKVKDAVAQEAVEREPLVMELQRGGTMRRHVDETSDQFSVYGELPPLQRPFMPKETALRPSLYQDQILPNKTNMGPAVLVKEDPRNVAHVQPTEAAVQKYGTQAIPFPQHHVDDACEDVWAELAGKELPIVRGVTSLRGAINGLPGVDGLVMSTSPGFPYTLTRPVGASGKQYLFSGEPGEYVIKDKELRERVVRRTSLAQAGTVMGDSLWIDMPKDELRSKEKIALAKTRVFTIPPVDFVILCRRYFLAFCKYMTLNNSELFSAVGMVPYSGEYNQMYIYLSAFSTAGFDGDYSAWDGRLLPQVIFASADIIERWYRIYDPNYSPVDAKVRRVLMEEIVHTRQICGGSVYETHQGMPSGCPLTAILNTLCNAVYLRTAYHALRPKDCELEYAKVVRDKIFGDDNVLGVSPTVQAWFNGKAVSSYFMEHGIKYTPASKKGDMIAIKPLIETSFLKLHPRQFANGFLVPTSDIETYDKLLNWVRKGLPCEQAHINNMNEVLARRWFEGREAFDACSCIFERLKSEYGLRGRLLDWRTLTSRYDSVGIKLTY
jgi:hypothetical protein